MSNQTVEPLTQIIIDFKSKLSDDQIKTFLVIGSWLVGKIIDELTNNEETVPLVYH